MTNAWRSWFFSRSLDRVRVVCTSSNVNRKVGCRIEDIAYTQKRAINSDIGSFHSTPWIRIFRSAMFDLRPAYVHARTVWVSFVMHIRWNVRFFEIVRSFCSSIWRTLISTIFNHFFSSNPRDELFFGVASEKPSWENTVTKVTAICC